MGVRKQLAALFASVALLFSVTVVNAAPATFDGESQAWWNSAGITVPTSVGHHIHVRVFNQPLDGQIVSRSTYNFNVRVTAHNQIGKITSIRVSDYGTVKQTWAMSLGPCTDCSVDLVLPVNFANWSVGRHEMRWTANIPTNSEGNRQFQSTGWQVCLDSCSPNSSGRSSNFTEARGWYTGHGYQNARLTSPVTSVRPGATVGVHLDRGSGGLTTTFSGVYIDPDFHHGSSGIVIRQSNGPFSGSIVIPSSLAAGTHKLVLLASDGKNAGVLAIAFTVG